MGTVDEVRLVELVVAHARQIADITDDIAVVQTARVDPWLFPIVAVQVLRQQPDADSVRCVWS